MHFLGIFIEKFFLRLKGSNGFEMENLVFDGKIEILGLCELMRFAYEIKALEHFVQINQKNAFSGPKSRHFKLKLSNRHTHASHDCLAQVAADRKTSRSSEVVEE